MKAANGCGLYLRRLWPGHYSLTPMLPSWQYAPHRIILQQPSIIFINFMQNWILLAS